MAIHAIGLCGQGITTVTTGAALMLRGERIELGNAANQQRRNIPIRVNLVATGAAASTWSAKWEVSPDGSSWTQWGSTFTGTIPASGAPVMAALAPLGGVLDSKNDYIRVNVTAVSGATLQGWLKRMD